MKDGKFPRRVTDITDEELWQAMRVPAGRPGADLLRQAIDAGLAGRRAAAYAKLAAYHREALADEWALIKESAANAPEPDAAVLKDTLNHKITTWHQQVVQFGKKIDWHPTPLLVSNSISGFHYFPWFRPVVTAYVKTGEKRYADFILDIVKQYYRVRQHPLWHHPVPGQRSLKLFVFNLLGINGRLSSWLPAYLALVNNDALTTAAAESFSKNFLGSARAVKPQCPVFHAHNIQTHGCRALLHLARVFPEFREARGWDRFACMRLHEQVSKGFFDDGCHRERVWGYGSHTLSSITQVYEFARRHGGLGKHEAAFVRAMRRSYRFYAKSSGPAPAMMMPTYGDAGADSNVKGILAAGRRHFPAGTNEVLGVDRTRSCLFRPSGFAVMRNGDDANSCYMNLNFGEFAGWHSHQDLLSLNLWGHGERLLEELCRFGPYSNPLDQLFRAPEAHNLLTIDGMIYDCRFMKGQDVAWYSDDKVDYFSATHWAYHYFVYGREKGDYSPNIEAKVRRTVVFVKDPGYVLVLDSVTDRKHPGRFNRAITQHWHSPSAFQQLAPDLARTKGRVGCLMAYARQDGLVRLDTGTDFSEAEGSVFGAAFSRHSLQARRWTPLDHNGIVGFATVLYPFKGKAPTLSFRALANDPTLMWRAEAYEVETSRGRDVLVLNPGRRPEVCAEGKACNGSASLRLGNGRGSIDVP